MEHVDALLIGSGQAANPLAKAFAEAGKRTVLVESRSIGGSCLNYGCTPTKTMIASARSADDVRRAAEFGISATLNAVQMPEVRERKRRMVASFVGGSQKRLESTEGLEIVWGLASFSGPKTVHVALNDAGIREFRADWIVIDTGARSTIPEIDGIGSVPLLDNESVMELDTVPEHLLILGGGYLGVEFGQMFRRFGSRVTIVNTAGHLLAHEDEDVSAEVEKILREDGIEIVQPADAKLVAKDGNEIALTCRTGGGDVTVRGSHLLLATGRAPNTGALNLKACGVVTDEHGFIRVNDRLETNVPGIFAAGDAKGGPMFTHISYDDYRVLDANLLRGGSRTISGRMVPYVVYTDPQLGRIGMTEREARVLGRKIRVAKMPMTSVARALEVGESRGLMKVVVDADSEEILGAAMLGEQGGEMAAMLQIAMMGGLKFPALRDAIFAHPTWAEALNNLFYSWQDGH
jgi:pyruvate/2-oxoglutarate dehydrogenase complex dihydrolipoamide dehydrogenase (E3) component